MSTDTSTMTAQDIAMAVLNGDYDNDLKALGEAVRARRKDVSKKEAQMNALFLSPGDRVRLKGLSPKLLNGAVVEVVKINKTRAVVKSTDETTGQAATRISSYGGTTVPLSCVEKIED